MVRRAPGEGLGQVSEADPVLLLEPWFAEPMLLGMVEAAQADAPAVGGLERGAAIGAGADVGALDRQAPAAGYTAMMAADPGPVSRAGA